jgi:hypothetical protein
MRSLAISLLLFLLLPLTTFAKTSADDQLINKLMAVHQFSAVDISPDGTRVACLSHCWRGPSGSRT